MFTIVGYVRHILRNFKGQISVVVKILAYYIYLYLRIVVITLINFIFI